MQGRTEMTNVRENSTKPSPPRRLSRIKARKTPLNDGQAKAVREAMRRHTERLNRDSDEDRRNGKSTEVRASELRTVDDQGREPTPKRSRKSKPSSSTGRLKNVKARCPDCRHRVSYKANERFAVECPECGGTIVIKPAAISWPLATILAVGGVAALLGIIAMIADRQ